MHPSRALEYYFEAVPGPARFQFRAPQAILKVQTRKSAKSSQFGVSRNAGHRLTAETRRREASSPPQRPSRALSGRPPAGHRTMGEDTFAQHLGVPRRGAPSCPVRAFSPMAWC
eukprot:5191744-Alexandrium_andersonii.AAC.1